MLQPPGLAWPRGCYAPEGSPEGAWRWCASRGELMLENPGSGPTKVRLSTWLKTGYPKRATVSFESDVLTGKVAVNSVGTLFEKEVILPPGRHLIRFHTDAKRIRAPGDPREMALRFENPHLDRVP